MVSKIKTQNHKFHISCYTHDRLVFCLLAYLNEYRQRLHGKGLVEKKDVLFIKATWKMTKSKSTMILIVVPPGGGKCVTLF